MNKRQAWTIGAAVVAVLILIVGWFVVISPVRSKTSSTKADTESIESRNQVLQAQLNQLIAQDKNVTSKQAQLSNVAAEIPGDPHLPHLIRDLTRAAGDANVDVTAITPSAPTGSAAQASSVTLTGGATAAGAKPAPVATYSTIPVALNVQGDYAGLEEFLQQLQTMKRIFVVNQVTIAPGSSSASTAGQKTPGGDPQTIHTLSATFNGSVFMTDPSNTSINLPALPAPSASGATSQH